MQNLPIVETDKDSFKNQEYLELYSYIDFEKIQNSKNEEFWVNKEDGKYISLKEWLNGKEPYEHK